MYLEGLEKNNFILYEPISFIFQALFFGGGDKLPFFLARHTIPGLGIVVDPCAAVIILIVTLLLCIGIKEVLLLS